MTEQSLREAIRSHLDPSGKERIGPRVSPVKEESPGKAGVLWLEARQEEVYYDLR